MGWRLIEDYFLEIFVQDHFENCVALRCSEERGKTVSGPGENIGEWLDFGPCFCCMISDFLVRSDGKDPVSHGLRKKLDPDSVEGSAIEIRRLFGYLKRGLVDEY